ncbi:hypothetical protein Psfp_01458 [Pelotomaculum sp. FP]|nr:hypothetical protein Psfp_01458 [Pelotomaculum sp. FP]
MNELQQKWREEFRGLIECKDIHPPRKDPER